MPSLKDHRFKIDDRCARTYDIPLQNLLETLAKYGAEDGLNLYPDFQRGRVWSETQQILFCEFILKGGVTSPILFNHPGWLNTWIGEMVIVDGLQRITALTRLMQDEIEVFGYTLSQFFDVAQHLRRLYIPFRIHTLQTRAEVLNWYLQVNALGTPHTIEEIERVNALLADVAQD